MGVKGRMKEEGKVLQRRDGCWKGGEKLAEDEEDKYSEKEHWRRRRVSRPAGLDIN